MIAPSLLIKINTPVPPPPTYQNGSIRHVCTLFCSYDYLLVTTGPVAHKALH